jgi:FkbM family methyltransferase
MNDTLTIFTGFFFFFIFSLAVSAIYFLHKKNRLIWKELFSLRANIASMRHELISIKKQLVLQQVSSLRLPPKLPSQYGEDIVLWNFFDCKRTGYYVEVGAYDGIGFSNSYFFEALGWSGILIEPVPEHYQQCLTNRPYSKVVHAALGQGADTSLTKFSVVSGSQGAGTLSFMGNNDKQTERICNEGGAIHNIEVPFTTLDELLKSYEGEIDFISIDVEGNELAVLKGLDLKKYKPRVLLIEDNENGKAEDVRRWLSSYGYIEKYRCENNVFYCHEGDKGVFKQ